MNEVYQKFSSPDSDSQLTIPGSEIELSPTVSIDVERFQREIDDPNLSEVEKREVVLALWSLLTAFVDLKFKLLPEKPDRKYPKPR